MKLFTAAIEKRLLENGNRQQPLRGTEDEIDFEPVVKLFTPPALWMAFIGRHQIGPLRQRFAACFSQIRSSTSTPSASARADKVRAEPVRRPFSICDR